MSRGAHGARVLVEVDGRDVAEIVPGAVVGERASKEGGLRTATLRAATRARVAEMSPDLLGSLELDELAQTHQREGFTGLRKVAPRAMIRP